MLTRCKKPPMCFALMSRRLLQSVTLSLQAILGLPRHGRLLSLLIVPRCTWPHASFFTNHNKDRLQARSPSLQLSQHILLDRQLNVAMQ